MFEKITTHHPVIGELRENFWSLLLQTRFLEYQSSIGVHGLAKVTDQHLELLMVMVDHPGRGQFRNFIVECKRNYARISVWFIANPVVEDALGRYGFTPVEERDSEGELLVGMRWDNKLTNKTGIGSVAEQK